MNDNRWLVYLSDPSQTLAASITEAEWLACDDPIALQLFIPRLNVSGRRGRLFACACCRRIWSLLLDPRSRDAVEVAERFADGAATSAELQRAMQQALEAASSFEGRPGWNAAACASSAVLDVDGQSLHGAAQSAAFSLADATGLDYLNEAEEEHWEGAVDTANRELMELFRDIMGNPFRPVSLDPSWRAWKDGTIPKLAQAIYDERAFGRMPILADALEEAGCTNDELLAHCRSDSAHVRGCWVLDLVLGKQ